MDWWLKWVVGRGLATEVGRWSLVVVEVTPVMIFLNGFASVGFKSTGFQISDLDF